ncbi:hypothetical protein FXO37_08860 [Capsicum annuum]|nr:hypothetical protein FXO37_08860 [Capsicum annuum]
MKGVMRFGKRGKLSSGYVGPYKILERIGGVEYRVALPPEMSFVHPVFHISMLRKCISDSSRVLEAPTLQLDENLTYEEEPVSIIDRQVRRLHSKELVSVKVLWKNHTIEEATWESKKDMRLKYPHLFQSSGIDRKLEENDCSMYKNHDLQQSILRQKSDEMISALNLQISSSANDAAMQENIAKKETEKECVKTPKLGRGFSLLLSMSDPKEDNGASKATGRSFCRDDAVKLIREAVNEILITPIQDGLLDTQSVTSDIISDQELSEAEGEVNNSSNSVESLTNLNITEDGKMLDQEMKDPKEERELPLTTNKPKTQRSKNWSKLKKLILPKISIKGLEKASKFNPRAPQLLPATPNQEPEKVDLRHQMADERKKA